MGHPQRWVAKEQCKGRRHCPIHCARTNRRAGWRPPPKPSSRRRETAPHTSWRERCGDKSLARRRERRDFEEDVISSSLRAWEPASPKDVGVILLTTARSYSARSRAKLFAARKPRTPASHY